MNLPLPLATIHEARRRLREAMQETPWLQLCGLKTVRHGRFFECRWQDYVTGAHARLVEVPSYQAAELLAALLPDLEAARRPAKKATRPSGYSTRKTA
jgi:hypothetical protein